MKVMKSFQYRRLPRLPQGDDLDGDFSGLVEEGVPDFGKGLKGRNEDSEDEEEEEEEDDEEENNDSEDENDDGETDEGEDLESGSESKSENEDTAAKDKLSVKLVKKPPKTKSDNDDGRKKSADSIPYTFPMPANYEEWVELVKDYDLDQQLVVIQRLRALYHPKLSPQNKVKLADLFSVLLDHLAVLSEQDHPVPHLVNDTLVRHLGELAPLFPQHVGNTCREKIIDFQKQLAQAISHNADNGEEELPTPLASQIAHMRLLAGLFSASDRYHPVITPLVTAIAQYLSRYTVSTLRDATAGIIFCSVLHEVHRLSRRFVPEAINYLQAIICSICAEAWSDAQDFPGYFPLSSGQRHAFEKFALDSTDKSTSNVKIKPLKWQWLVTSDSKSSHSMGIDDKLALLGASVKMLHKWADCYFSASAFIEVFTHIEKMLSSIISTFENLPKDLCKQLKNTRDHIKSQLSTAQKKRQPLKLQHHKPIAIQTVAPKFEENYSLDAHYDPDHDRSEIQKLRRLHKKEQRGVIRELRRDAQFISSVQLQKQREKDSIYGRKMKTAWGVLENDQGDLKKLDKLREREKKGKI